ncbi:MAG: methyltransferase domain-containing protein [Candidatus Hydrogenedentes bacterium]|nr:methyltransferase domain-containing protein [Candidatus Hydrogenedentota bacterium]
MKQTRKAHNLSLLKRTLDIPELRGVDLDSPTIIPLRAALVQRKRFLRHIYCDWYRRMANAAASAPPGPRVEIGSGPGFLKTIVPGVITSELVCVGSVDLVFSCESMPFASNSLSVLFLQNVFHHVPHPALFLQEAARCLRIGGRIVMIEPYNTPWSRIVWKRLHHEAFEVEAGWELPGSTPLSTANGALPWIVFERDRALFDQNFPQLRVTHLRPFMPLSYLLSGGVSMRSLAPGFFYPAWRPVESLLDRLGLFAEIHLTRV